LGLIGGIAASRPLLASAVIAFGFAALAAVGFQRVDAAFKDAGLAMLVSLALTVLLPASTAAIAPRNFWLRAIYAGFAAGLLLAVRRLVLQLGVPWGTLDLDIALAAAAAVTFFLTVAAPLWRAALGHSLIGLSAVVLATAAGLAAIAIEIARVELIPAAGPLVGMAAGLGAALAVQIAAGFSRAFAEGRSNFEAAAEAARDAAAPAFFGIIVGVAVAFAAIANDPAASDTMATIRIAAAVMAFAVAAPLIMLPGALSLRAPTELTAVIENRRRAMVRPFLNVVRALLPPSSAIAATSIFVIAAIVAAFLTPVPARAGEIIVIAAAAAASALTFVSARTSIVLTLFLLAATRISGWTIEILGLPPLTEFARVVAASLAAVISAQLFLAWRDRRNPRRKAREVAQMALADALFAMIAASALAAAALASSEAAGLWSEGVEAALLLAALSLAAAVVGPALITAASAIFGRR
jgi:hypothetical protein